MTWPWPLEEVDGETFDTLIRPALAEVGVGAQARRGFTRVDEADPALLMQAQRLAYAAMGVDYEEVDPDEYERRYRDWHAAAPMDEVRRGLFANSGWAT